MHTPTFKTTDFEGPLDLLLALISKNKMNIYDIEILSLINQYLEIIQNEDEVNLDANSEFIEMATRLIYMKSVFLLPKQEEQEKLRDELTGILIEYSTCKLVSKKLKEMSENVFYAVRKQAKIQFDTIYSTPHDKMDLKYSMGNAISRKAKNIAPQKEQFDELVAVPFVSVTSKIVYLMRNLMRKNFSNIKSFFNKSNARSDTVATFLAILELIRAGRITIDENDELFLNKKTLKRTK